MLLSFQGFMKPITRSGRVYDSFLSNRVYGLCKERGSAMKRTLTAQSNGFGRPPLQNSSLNEESKKQEKLKNLLEEYQQSKNKKIFEDQLVFPTVFVMKIIGTNDATFVQDTLQNISIRINCDPQSIPFSIKDNGKYVSITVKPTFLDASQLYSVYDDIGKDSRVKFIL